MLNSSINSLELFFYLDLKHRGGGDQNNGLGDNLPPVHRTTLQNENTQSFFGNPKYLACFISHVRNKLFHLEHGWLFLILSSKLLKVTKLSYSLSDRRKQNREDILCIV